MKTTSTIRTAAAALILVSALAPMSGAQYQTTTTRPGSFYVGLAAGASMPSGQFADFYNNGWNVAVPIGWKSARSPLGMRLDVAYSKWGGATVAGEKFGSAAVWDGMLDATLDMPLGARKTSSFYLVGGGGVHYFPKYGGESYSTQPGTDTTTVTPPGTGYQVNAVTTSERSSQTKLGLNGGAGLSFDVAHSSLFVETRYVTVFTKDERTNYWPLIAGIRWTMR